MPKLRDADVKALEEYIATGFQKSFPVEEGACSEIIVYLRHGKYADILESELSKAVFNKFLSCASTEELLDKSLQYSVECYIDQNELSLERQLDVLCVGISSLLFFVRANWTGPPVEPSDLPPWLRDRDAVAAACLVLDGEALYPSTRHVQLLAVAAAVFKTTAERFSANLPTTPWWLMRYLVAHQRVLEEASPTLHASLVSLLEGKVAEASSGPLVGGIAGVLLPLESALIWLHFGQVLRSKELLLAALGRAGLTLELVGAMGKRTRYQEKELAQLTLKVELEATEQPSGDGISGLSSEELADRLPKDLQLDDDVRLNRIQYAEDSGAGEYPKLSPSDQAVILGAFVQTQKSQPKDRLADEELMPYLECVLAAPQSWSVQMSALLLRCRLESWHSRTVERSMNQCQILVDAIDSDKPPVAFRWPQLFSTPLPPRWHIESELAHLLLSLGAVNSALDIFLRLEEWEAVVNCYHMLKLRHKAAEIVRHELQKKETVKLWCLLGDSTDDPVYYERAWELSGRRSARAQRHWGLFYFNRKQYDKAIQHLSKSLEINSLQAGLWSRLGFACLEESQWDMCATAYRRYCALDNENFEAWNNLAKAYVKLGQKARAWKALKEALKCNFENWKVWDNLMIVSTDCAEFEDVIQAYHRILDLKAKHVDEDVLRILVKAVANNLPDNAGVPSRRLIKAALGLFGRLTGQVTNNPTLWRLYAQLTSSQEVQTPETLQRTAQYLQRAHRSAVQDLRWASDRQTAADVLGLCIELVDAYLQCFQKFPTNQGLQMLSSGRLSLKSVLAKVKQEQTDLASSTLSEELKDLVSTLEVKLESIESEMAQLRGQSEQQ
ncbi:tetratricopeptide repeat protein 27 [Schistocerca piceifrons]|uniref:tetratricopeptide repeat protein 27 n=1 Tax=Schistocerca piceifrons TaxID=274613 RepID=UPI001F5E695A|nr:tetratricopeptide repeat protein 27 [Schistocerca piceifrons]